MPNESRSSALSRRLAREAVGAADHENNGWSVIGPPFGELGRKAGAVEIFSARIEQNDSGVFWDDIGERDRFLEHALVGIGGAAFPDFDDFDIAQAKLTAGLIRALAIALGQFGFRALFRRPTAATTMRIVPPRLSARPPRVLARSPTTFFPDCRRRELPAGRHGRSRRRRRSAPSRLAACPRRGCARTARLFEVLDDMSATALTWRCDRPLVTTM